MSQPRPPTPEETVLGRIRELSTPSDAWRCGELPDARRALVAAYCVKRRSQGATLERIGRELVLSRAAVAYYLRRYGCRPPAAPRPPRPRYWYYVTHFECPICGRCEEVRERLPPPRPEDPAERQEVVSRFDWCNW